MIPDHRTQWRGGRRASDFDETARQLAARVLAEYAEQPGLSLTLEQAPRLFGMDAATCANVLLMLARHRLLATTPTGRPWGTYVMAAPVLLAVWRPSVRMRQNAVNADLS